MDQNRKTGLWGEVLAVRYLRDHGYRILNTNFRVGHLEIDIVAEKESVLCIVEVKTRAPSALLAPSESVDCTKQQNLQRAAAAVRKIYAPDALLRFDVIEVLFADRQNYRIRHLIDSF